MELQHLDIKLFITAPDGLDLEPFIGVFHRWIQERSEGPLLFDVADYRHLPAGPGVILVGHAADLALDSQNGRLGLRRRQKTGLPGDNQVRLATCLRALWQAAAELEAEPELAGLCFDYHRVSVAVNDRQLAPNTPETRRALGDALRGVFGGAAGDTLAVEEDADPRHIARVTLRAPQPLPVAAGVPAWQATPVQGQ